MSVESLQIIIDAVDNASKVVNGIAKNFTSLGTKMSLGVTAPIVGGFALAVKSAMDFESAMADVNKVTDMKAHSKESEAFGQEILKLSRTIPLAATELATISAAGAGLGVLKKDLVEFTTVTAKMATAFDMTADSAGDSIGKMMNLYKLNVKGASDLGDTINHVSDKTSAKASQIVDVMTRIGGVATNFGLTANEAAGMSTAFLMAGGTSETAGTAINGFLQTLKTATVVGGTFGDGLKRMGLSATDLEGAIKNDAVAGVQMFLTKLNELNPEERSKAIAQMFGKGGDTALITKLAADVDLYNKAMGLATDTTASAGSMQREFAARSATTANQLQLLKNNATEVGVTLGSSMLPAINSMATSVGPAMTGFAKFADAHPGIMKVGVAFAMVAAVIGPVLVAIGAVISAVGTIGTAFGTVVGFIAGLAGAFSGFMAILSTIGTVIGLVFSAIAAAVMTPAVAIAALVAGLAAAAYMIIANWTAVSAFFAALGGVISAVFQHILASAASSFAGAVASAQSAAAGIGAGFQSAVASVSAAMSAIKASVISSLAGLAAQAAAAGSRIVQGIASGIMAGVGAVGAAMSSVGAAIAAKLPGSPVKSGPLVAALNGRKNAGYRITEMLGAGIGAGTGGLGSAMNAATSPVASAIPSTSSGGGGGSFSPSITINVANAGEATPALENELRAMFARLNRDYQANQARVSYG